MSPEAGPASTTDTRDKTGSQDKGEPVRKGQPSLEGQPLNDLINMRDRFLTECFEIESGRRFVIDDQDAQDRLGLLRQRIDEIHEEMARRDMGGPQGTPSEPDVQASFASDAPTEQNQSSACARTEVLNTATQRASRPQVNSHDAAGLEGYLNRIEARIQSLDAMAAQAQARGAFEVAVRCMLAAQDLDRERLSASGCNLH